MKASRTRDRRKGSSARLIHLDELSRLKNLPSEEDKWPPAYTIQTVFFSSNKRDTSAPKVAVHSVEGPPERSLWRVEVRASAHLSIHLPGLSVGTVQRPSPPVTAAERSPVGLDGSRPKFHGVNFLPEFQKPVVPGRKLIREFGGVFPPDERQVLTDTSYPWLLTGKIFTSDGISGSGALVGTRHVLTAKHLRPTKSIAKGSWWIKFVPHSFDGAEPFDSSYVSDTRYYTANDPQHDYMVCRLYDPLGTRLGYFGSQEYIDRWNGLAVWASVGYPGDFQSGLRPAVQVPAIIEGRNTSGGGQALETEADLWYGASGGPFWAWFDIGGGNRTPRIVGVVMGEYDVTPKDDDNSLSGADMVHLIDWARANWP